MVFGILGEILEDIIGVLIIGQVREREAECGDGGIVVELSGLGCRYLFVPGKSWMGKVVGYLEVY